LNKKLILDRLELLMQLCEETEPERKELADYDHTDLFTGHLIAAKELLDRVETGVSDSENEMPSIMKQANNIWRFRNNVKVNGWGEYVDMHAAINDFLLQNQKINAIKYYRKYMYENFGQDIGLRDAKDFIDNFSISTPK
jgi:ribosomal protein L7/L12